MKVYATYMKKNTITIGYLFFFVNSNSEHVEKMYSYSFLNVYT